MVTLVVFPTPWPKVPNGSPYCMKVENYLRIAKIPYEKKLTVDLKSAPKKRLPYIIHNGNKIADSQVIIPYLQNTFGIKSDLSAEDLAYHHVIERMLEESLMYKFLFVRWAEDQGWEQFSKAMFAKAPALVRIVFGGMMRKRVNKRLRLHGTSDHSAEEVYAFAREDISALAKILGDKKYFCGNSAGALDASAYAFLGNLFHSPMQTELVRIGRDYKNLVDYADRMHQELYAK